MSSRFIFVVSGRISFFLLLSSIILYLYTTFSSFIHLLMDTWFISISWLLLAVLQWIWEYRLSPPHSLFSIIAGNNQKPKSRSEHLPMCPYKVNTQVLPISYQILLLHLVSLIWIQTFIPSHLNCNNPLLTDFSLLICVPQKSILHIITMFLFKFMFVVPQHCLKYCGFFLIAIITEKIFS